MLEPKVAIFDEIDTGLDVDALKLVATAINKLHKNGTAVIIVTHYQNEYYALLNPILFMC